MLSNSTAWMYDERLAEARRKLEEYELPVADFRSREAVKKTAEVIEELEDEVEMLSQQLIRSYDRWT